MTDSGGIFSEAVRLITSGDRDTWQAIGISLRVTLTATAIASVVGVPLGVLAGLADYRAKPLVFLLLNTLLSVPTVVIGLTLYLLLSRSGPLGELGLLFTTKAMVLGQVVLIIPILTAFTATAVNAVPEAVAETARSLGADWRQAALAVLEEARFGVLAAVVAGFGRAISEVGAAQMLGGNIRGATRNMTTAIALETSRGEFGLGLALGTILIVLALGVNLLFHYFQQRAQVRR